MKILLLIASLFLFINLFAQNKFKNEFSIGTNPLSLAEPHMGIGLSINNRFNKKVAVWGEISYFFDAKYIINNWKSFKGYRLIFQPRYFLNTKKTIFVAPEFRYKNLNFDSKLNYLNIATKDTLRNFITAESQKIIGGAILIGKNINFSKLFLWNLLLDLVQEND